MEEEMGTAGVYESFKIFYNGIALMHQIANQQTMFLAYLLADMDSRNEVHMTPNKKARIMKAVGYTGKNPQVSARQLLGKLVKVNLLVSLGGSCYMVRPKFATRYKDKAHIVNNKDAKYMELRMRATNNGVTQVEIQGEYDG